jgi:hypothetical protein
VAEANYERHLDEVEGHPVREVYLAAETEPTLITVCAQCGHMKSIIFLSKDRWFCFQCKTQGETKPDLYPVR